MPLNNFGVDLNFHFFLKNYIFLSIVKSPFVLKSSISYCPVYISLRKQTLITFWRSVPLEVDENPIKGIGWWSQTKPKKVPMDPETENLHETCVKFSLDMNIKV